MKIYGNTNTNLTLTPKALDAYNGSGLVIVDNENGTYSTYDRYVKPFNLVSENDTAEQVIEMFEDLYDTTHEDE